MKGCFEIKNALITAEDKKFVVQVKLKAGSVSDSSKEKMAQEVVDDDEDVMSYTRLSLIFDVFPEKLMVHRRMLDVPSSLLVWCAVVW